MRLLVNPFRNLGERISNKLTLPARYKDTYIEKWFIYWKGLLRDYRDVFIGVGKEVVTKPVKATAIGSSCFALYKFAVNNPNEVDFMCSLRQYNNRMCMINSSLHNPVSEDYLKQLEQLINQNRLRFMSLGIFTILWEDKYDKDDCTYPAICDYTRVRYFDIPSRIIDVGFCKHFWRLDWKMMNFDVSYL